MLLVSGIIGLPVPDEALLMLADYLAARGTLALAPVLLVATLGSTCGVTISYVLGRWLSGMVNGEKRGPPAGVKCGAARASAMLV